MAVYSLSRKAVSDLEAIFEYTVLEFGLEQARDCLLSLHERFQTLAEHPLRGRTAYQLAPELRRVEHWSHVVLGTDLVESGADEPFDESQPAAA